MTYGFLTKTIHYNIYELIVKLQLQRHKLAAVHSVDSLTICDLCLLLLGKLPPGDICNSDLSHSVNSVAAYLFMLFTIAHKVIVVVFPNQRIR